MSLLSYFTLFRPGLVLIWCWSRPGDRTLDANISDTTLTLQSNVILPPLAMIGTSTSPQSPVTHSWTTCPSVLWPFSYIHSYCKPRVSAISPSCSCLTSHRVKKKAENCVLKFHPRTHVRQQKARLSLPTQTKPEIFNLWYLWKERWHHLSVFIFVLLLCIPSQE